MTTRAGIVLGGGYASRFDEGDKTLADFEGRPLIAHAVEPLQSVVGTVVVSCRAEQVEAFERVLDDVEFVPDPEPDEGPLAGLDAALQRIEADAVALATADRPCVPSTLYSQIFETLDADGVVIDADGIRQPAPAVFDTRALRGEVQRHRDTGERRLRSILADLDVDLLAADTVRDQWGTSVLTDVNTVAELDRLRRDGC
ncbi:molybdenum cofactor guanylyltransferase [Halapricum salinum]|uniref:molybdenum cofactor guanylyltransferase n=1 Tax=Halapricum salinum TaxID=1457250 RepID=UPI000678CC41|nr:molybdenum cofactor guanylyltransferase [Halapricum salinum]